MGNLAWILEGLQKHEGLSLMLVGYAYPMISGLFFLLAISLMRNRLILHQRSAIIVAVAGCMFAVLAYGLLSLTIRPNPLLIRELAIVPMRFGIWLFAALWSTAVVLDVVLDLIAYYKAAKASGEPGSGADGLVQTPQAQDSAKPARPVRMEVRQLELGL